MKIKDCKITKAIQCDKKSSIVEVAKILRDNKQRHIIVTEKGAPVGIISTTDINNKVVAEAKDPKKLKAEEIMTNKIIVKDIEEQLGKAYFEMIKANIFSCPVTSKGKLSGILEAKEAMNILIKAKINR